MNKLYLKTLLLCLFYFLGMAKTFAHDIEVKNTDGVTIYYNYYYDSLLEFNPQLQVTRRNNNNNSYSGNIVIPKTVTYNGKTYNVTSIGQYAFSQCTELISITIPNSVTSIGFFAFDDCTGLTSVTIPNSVTSIGLSAFADCAGLVSVTIGSGVTEIEDKAFYGCSGLTSVTIPNNVTSIGNSVFKNCSGLTSISIPNSVTSIGNSAFENCSELTSVSIPNSVTSIGNSAFYGCGELDVIIEDGMETLYFSGHLTFGGGCSINKLYLGRSIDVNYNWQSGMPFTSIKNLIIGDSVTAIEDYTFYGCCVESITIPKSITSIGHDAFHLNQLCEKLIVQDLVAWCGISFANDAANPLYFSRHLYCDENTEITNLIIPDGITTILEYAFMGGRNLNTVTIPQSVTSIGHYAFGICYGLKSVTIPESVTSIDSYAFSGCYGLTSFTIPKSVTSVGSHAFLNCTGLTSVNISPNITSIKDHVFSLCTNLASVIIPEGIINIDSYAFEGCSNLTSVTIPSSMTSFGEYAFDGCDNLETVVSHIQKLYDIKTNVFSRGAYLNATLYVPEGTLRKYMVAEGWRDFLYIEEGMPTSIASHNNSTSEPTETERYTIDGKPLSAPQRGINVVKMSDGTIKKVLMK